MDLLGDHSSDSLPSGESPRSRGEKKEQGLPSAGPGLEAIERVREFRQRVFGERTLDIPVTELIREGRGETATDDRPGES